MKKLQNLSSRAIYIILQIQGTFGIRIASYLGKTACIALASLPGKMAVACEYGQYYTVSAIQSF